MTALAAPIAKVETTSLAHFGSRDEVRELAERLKTMMPGGQKYTAEEALTLSQISVAHDLDPFNGEVWLIKGDDGKVYGALIGLKGFRKHAKRQANYWGFGPNGGFTRVTDPAQLKALSAPDNSIVFEYRIMDEVTLEGYTKSLGALMKHQFTLEQAQKIMGPAPVTIGVGIYVQGEKTKMKPAQCAMFRAEKDCLKRRFDVKWRYETIDGRISEAPIEIDDTDEPDADELEAEYIDTLGEDAEQEQAEREEQTLEQLGFDTSLPVAKDAIYQAVVDAGLSDTIYAAKNALTGWCKTGFDTPDKAVAWMRLYRGWRDNDKSTKEAAELANKGETPK